MPSGFAGLQRADTTEPAPARLCPVCSREAGARIGMLSNTKIAPLVRTEYELLHCRQCDVVYQSPLPSERDLKVLYVDELQFDYHTEDDSQRIVEFMTGRLRDLLKRIGSPAAPAVLEIGAGPAWMARAAKTLLPRCVTVAQDVTKEVAGQCPWVDHYVVAFTDSPEIDAHAPYDVVSMTHVIEHVTDPLALLRRLRPLTRGAVFITAPHRPTAWNGTIESWRKYSYNHVPAHLQFFSERGMRLLAQASGFAVGHWDSSSEEGQSFEAWLLPAGGPSARPPAH